MTPTRDSLMASHPAHSQSESPRMDLMASLPLPDWSHESEALMAMRGHNPERNPS